MITPIYSPAPGRYENGMKYRRCGKSGILLPEISLGLWHNFGDVNTSPTRYQWHIMHSTRVSPILTSPTITALPAALQKKHSV